MSLDTRRHEPIHDKTGDDLARIKANFDNGKHLEVLDFGPEAAIIYQIQKMQEELDYLRTEIALNKAKTSMTLGRTSTTALAGDTNIVSIGANTRLSFGDMIESRGTYSIVLTATRDFGRGNVSKSITLTLT
jgi:deoxycytidylate deaminase